MRLDRIHQRNILINDNLIERLNWLKTVAVFYSARHQRAFVSEHGNVIHSKNGPDLEQDDNNNEYNQLGTSDNLIHNQLTPLLTQSGFDENSLAETAVPRPK
ncbi:MAG: hypothetical protein GY805_00215, partial [Chloroflexi bacterium]|nr:hypothetical protein [Chloroflexota bacterium]